MASGRILASREMQELVYEQGPEAAGKAVHVYGLPVRLWHWINALAIFVLMITGYLIAQPIHSTPGEASDHFLMGYIRFAHFAAAYIFAIGFVARLYWAFASGSDHAKQIFYLPIWRKSWWSEMLFMVRWYAFLEKKPMKYVGHNPLAHITMVLLFVVNSAFMICTGFALYGEGLGMDSWAYLMFGWVIHLFGDSYTVHLWHNFAMWVMLCFVIVHVYVAIREDIMSRQSLISTMIGGDRMFKDDDI